ncbi:CHC2 zinc finger domain-containing protein [Niastella populi]|uniref:Zinc finger CHC2-type domain-containing protein n=1 Tax=Niastella populi TaxID=550983 RepID=A0A1V9GAT3_9BACT|nr:CHC2 zinc finger domain-containing protein [Niastella populi]OQP67672.1 hypothetical protein A4R26_32900 [Niastella populi]
MEIRDIKQQLTINEVLQHYGLQPDKNHRLLCPFHPDKTPSLQIYPKTNTFCCFSSNCTAGTGDVIQFIQLKENCSKHEALVKATALAGDNAVIASPPPPASKLLLNKVKSRKVGKRITWIKLQYCQKFLVTIRAAFHPLKKQ